jgi:hypothetical protein
MFEISRFPYMEKGQWLQQDWIALGKSIIRFQEDKSTSQSIYDALSIHRHQSVALKAYE